MTMVFVEGPPDLALVRALGFTRKNSKRLGPKGEVIKHLMKKTGALALVDEDPGETSSRRLQSMRKEELEHNLLCYTDAKSGNKIIALRPRLEDWIIGICKVAGVSLEKGFSLPESPKELHRILPQQLPGFERLLKRLLTERNPSLLYLQDLLIGPAGSGS